MAEYKVVVTSGYFNPIHAGHLALLREARRLGSKLIVIVNNDRQVALKGAEPFMTETERLEVVKAIRWVDDAVIAEDQDSTVKKTLARIRPDIFAKGGDSVFENIPELSTCYALGIELALDVGGGKIQSSSWLKKRLSSPESQGRTART